MVSQRKISLWRDYLRPDLGIGAYFYQESVDRIIRDPFGICNGKRLSAGQPGLEESLCCSVFHVCAVMNVGGRLSIYEIFVNDSIITTTNKTANNTNRAVKPVFIDFLHLFVSNTK